MAEKTNSPASLRRICPVKLLLIPIILTGIAFFTGCDTFFGNLDGDVSTNVAPVVEFSNVPAQRDTFSYAPVVYWRGRDADGFVEYFSYADVIDATALVDPEYYIDFIPEEDWVRTEATFDTVYLLTETGQVTEHVFYVKCTDDRGQESPVIFRTFYRSNEPPRVPEIKWATAPDDSFANDAIMRDTLYVLDNVTDTWPGLSFVWRSSDPDDRDLYQIPLEFRYYLEKTPHDTIWQWVSSNWTGSQELQIAGLETGHYTLSVWARDDGFEMSERPASITFDVYKPTFEQSILILNTTREKLNFGAWEVGQGDVLPGTQIGDMYREMVQNYPDAEYLHYPDTLGTYPWKAFLGRFKLVIWMSENRTPTTIDFSNDIREYVRIGGRLWALGYYLRSNNVINDNIAALGNIAWAGQQATFPPTLVDFTSATPGVDSLPVVKVDTSRMAETYDVYYPSSRIPYPFLPGVDVMATGSGAETAYYYRSYTDTASGDIWNEEARVVENADTFYYPPTPVDCLVRLNRQRVLEVTRVENVSRGVVGEVLSVTNNIGTANITVVRISYPYGEPWSRSDTLEVDYRFQPYSVNHLRPCASRYERIAATADGRGYEIRYRVAIFAFPLYFMDNSEGKVTEMFNNMLDWFFYPIAH